MTFLGDHMQLPPVSEIKNDDINAMKKSFLWSQSSLFFETLFLQKNEDDVYQIVRIEEIEQKTENMEEKRKFALWAKDSTLQMAKKLYKEDNCKSQSEFIEIQAFD